MRSPGRPSRPVPCLAPVPSLPPSRGAAKVCDHPILAHLWPRFIVIFWGDKEHKENGILRFRITLEGFSLHSSDGSQRGPAHKEAVILGGGGGCFQGTSHTWRYNGLAQERRGNWQLSGLKGVLLGRRERLQV